MARRVAREQDHVLLNGPARLEDRRYMKMSEDLLGQDFVL